jgi:hypothetical protein
MTNFMAHKKAIFSSLLSLTHGPKCTEINVGYALHKLCNKPNERNTLREKSAVHKTENKNVVKSQRKAKTSNRNDKQLQVLY